MKGGADGLEYWPPVCSLSPNTVDAPANFPLCAPPAVIHRDAKQGAMLRGWLTEQIMPVYEKRTLPMTASVAQICAGLHIPDPQSERDAWMAAAARDNRQAPCQVRGDDEGYGR